MITQVLGTNLIMIDIFRGRHLKVVAKKKILYNSLLPKGAEDCEYKVGQIQSLIIVGNT